MKVFKFGGASVKDAEGIRNLERIISAESGNLVIVVSAFGKMTNALEKVLRSWFEGGTGYAVMLDEIYNYHGNIIKELFGSGVDAMGRFDNSFGKLREFLAAGKTQKKTGYDFSYDQIVSYGEVWSTIIVAGYLKTSHPEVEWIDIREQLLTDDRYRDANILWTESSGRISRAFDFGMSRIFVTQGFIGGTIDGYTTTLGREGSDYTAAILSNILDAGCTVVWKDVPGILNADPKWLDDATKLEEISYREAVEMTFSGAKVIHPKTIKPLQNKNIPLYVRSFLSPDDEGTVIKADPVLRRSIPVFVRKEGQLLITLLPRDFSFVMGDKLSHVFHAFMKRGIKVNLVEASAVSIDVCVDDERNRISDLLNDLRDEFSAVYNEDVEMLSVRHYTPDSVERIIKGREILIEQRTRSTVRFIVKDKR